MHRYHVLSWRYHDLDCVTMQYPDEDGNAVTKIALKIYQDLQYFLCINLLKF